MYDYVLHVQLTAQQNVLSLKYYDYALLGLCQVCDLKHKMKEVPYIHTIICLLSRAY